MFRRVDYTAEELFTVVKQAILDAKEHTSELYLDVKPDIGFSVAEWLDADEEVKEIRHRTNYDSNWMIFEVAILPTISLLQWMLDEKRRMESEGWLTAEEAEMLKISSGTSFKNFKSPYDKSWAEPDVSVYSEGHTTPSLVIDCEWGRYCYTIFQSKGIWLKGAEIETLLMPEFIQLPRDRTNIAGSLHIYHTPNVRGLSQPMRPKPLLGFRITRKQLFGKAILPGRDPNDTWAMDLAGLDRKLRSSLKAEGWTMAYDTIDT